MPVGVFLAVEMVRVEVAEPLGVSDTGLTLNEVVGQLLVAQLTPEGGVTVAESVTEPEKLLTLVKVMSDEPVRPPLSEREVGLAEMPKSHVLFIETGMLTECDMLGGELVG